MKRTIKHFVLAALCMVMSFSMNAQFTTSTLSGKVTDALGAVPGAAIVAVHTPSGSQYYAVSNAEGRYTIQGMRPGGPYEITVQMLGYKTNVYKDITLQLSETYVQDVVLADNAELLDEVIVVASSSKFTAEKTGASTNVSNREMMSLPNTDRSVQGIAKLSPYSNGLGFAGGDGRSTNFTVDGANLNNNFGLSSKLPGGGTPISLDALDEIQLVVAPYDVRQSNFVGGGINAITKSGTNTFKGTAYTYYSDEGFRGNIIDHEKLAPRNFEQTKVYGFTLGGPIIKDKLFFFVNYESEKKPGEVIEDRPDKAKAAVLDQIKSKLQKDYGYDPGNYDSFPGGDEGSKILARLDWNISKNHKFSFRYNRTIYEHWVGPNPNSCDDQFRNKAYSRSANPCNSFSGNMYSENSNVTSYAAELNSRFGDKISNKLLATYTDINDQRGSSSNGLFPHIDIMNGDFSSGALIPYTSLGYELFTYNNGVKNKNLIISDDLNFYLGDHTITAGLRFENMNARNSYMRNGTGYYRFASPEDFLNGALPVSFCLTYGFAGDENPAGVVDYNQTGIYIQDEWKVTDNFKLSYGLRGDMITFNDDAIVTNPNIAAIDYGGKHIDTGVWPTNRPQISPRIGFNWDVNGDKRLIVRGGTGIFQGRLPLVFFTNMPQYSGMIQGGYNVSAVLYKNEIAYGTLDKNNNLTPDPSIKAALEKLNNGGKFMTNPDEIVKAFNLPQSASAESAGLGTQPYISGVDKDFRMPQIIKTSVAVDYMIPVDFPFTVTAEAIYNKTLWGIMMEDWSLNYGSPDIKHFNGPDNRVMNANAGRYHSTNAYVLTNTKKGWGYTANITLNAEPVKNLKLMAAYTHTESKELSGMPGSAANSVFISLPTISGANITGLQRSRYVLPDKAIASVNYYIPSQGLNFNLLYSAYSADGNSYIYTNDMNGDGNAADLIYIPKSQNELKFKDPADASAFWNFVNSDNYLKKHKGEYAEAYAARSPWVHRFDLNVTKDFKFEVGKTKHNIQVGVSIDNIGNLINSSWGLTKISAYQTSISGTISPLKYEGVDETNTPVFSMIKINGNYPTDNYTSHYINTSECWHAMLSLKYFFN